MQSRPTPLPPSVAGTALSAGAASAAASSSASGGFWDASGCTHFLRTRLQRGWAVILPPATTGRFFAPRRPARGFRGPRGCNSTRDASKAFSAVYAVQGGANNHRHAAPQGRGAGLQRGLGRSGRGFRRPRRVQGGSSPMPRVVGVFGRVVNPSHMISGALATTTSAPPRRSAIRSHRDPVVR